MTVALGAARSIIDAAVKIGLERLEKRLN